MAGDLTYFKRNAVNYYGVFLKGYDKGNPYKDKLTVVRKNYYESGLQTQKRKFTDMGDDGKIYKYNYCLNEDTVLKWKVVNNANRVLERVPPQRDGDDYRVEIRDNFGKIQKCIYFGPYHNWIKTKYYGSDSSEPEAELVYWDKNGMAAILKYSSSESGHRPEVLHPCRAVEDPQLLRKITAKLGVPQVSTLCSNGYVYFANDTVARQWERYCREPSLLGGDDIVDEFTKESSEKKIDLTQTDDVIIPKEAKQDSLIFEKDKPLQVPSRQIGSQPEDGEPQLTKLHSEVLEDDEKQDTPQGRNVFDILFDDDDDEEDGDSGKNTAPEADEKNDKPLSEEKPVSLDGEYDPGFEITREFDIPKKSAEERSYSYKRARPAASESSTTLDQRAKEKTIEFMKQSLSDALNSQNYAQNPLRDITPDTKPEEKAPKAAPAIAPAAEKKQPEQTVTVIPAAKTPEGTISPTKVIESGSETYRYYGPLNPQGERHGRGRTAMNGDLTAYDGEYANDKRDGFGAYYYSNGKICYVGDWTNNRRNGIGISFKPKDRSMYVGKWENNCPVGMGAKFDSNGDLKFVGRWENGSREGVGMLYNPEDESVFVSRWEDDKLSDKGTLFDSNGNLIYSGEWKNGRRNGIGTQYDSSGQVSYHGEWKDGKFNGEGTLTLSNGCRVSGTFVMGTIEGYAVFTTKRGKKLYEGEWVRNRFHGNGKKYDIKTGSYYSGSFAEGRAVGILSCFDRDGELVYKGELRNEIYHGTGTAFKNGEKTYEGEWKNGERSGVGSEYENGRLVYKGKFKEDVRRGIGTSYTQDGKPEFSGHWTDGRRDGEGLLYKDGKPYLAGTFSMGVPDGRINEIRGGSVIRECIYSDGRCVYMRDFSEDGLYVKYEGYVRDGVYEGMGCGFSQYGEKYFEGIFKEGKPFKSMKVRLQRLEDLTVRTKLIGSEYSKYVKGPNYVIEREIGAGSYSGLLVGGRPFGKGTIIYTDHGYTGAFEDGAACGLGVIYEWNGSEVKGTFVKEAGSNTTEITFADGVTYHMLKEDIAQGQ